ncbi:MAG: RNA 2',3'-cyclic phosphodiesterase [Terriglobales bacterium]
MRCFFALPVLNPVQQRLAEALASWQRQWPEVKWEHPAALHLTLQFIGDWPAERAAELAAAAANVRWAAFPLMLTSVGAFPSLQRPRTLWAGVAPTPLLRKLADDLGSELSRLGIRPDERPFTPHVSLGRLPHGERLPGWRSLAAVECGPWQAAEFCLFESVAGLPPADRYQIRARFAA